jgi:hypothetical protein
VKWHISERPCTPTCSFAPTNTLNAWNEPFQVGCKGGKIKSDRVFNTHSPALGRPGRSRPSRVRKQPRRKFPTSKPMLPA